VVLTAQDEGIRPLHVSAEIIATIGVFSAWVSGHVAVNLAGRRLTVFIVPKAE
jgi:hypothetical protein